MPTKKVKKPVAPDIKGLLERLETLQSENERLEKALFKANEEVGKSRRDVESIREMQPPKLSPTRLKSAVDAVLFSLLMDAKAALMTSQSPTAADVALRIAQLETNIGPVTLVETVLIQKAKAISNKLRNGTEVDRNEMETFFSLASKLTGFA